MSKPITNVNWFKSFFKLSIILLIGKLYESYFSPRKLKEYYNYFEENFPCEVFEFFKNEVSRMYAGIPTHQKPNILENDKKARGFEFPHKFVHRPGNSGLPQHQTSTNTLGDLPAAEAAGGGEKYFPKNIIEKYLPKNIIEKVVSYLTCLTFCQEDYPWPAWVEVVTVISHLALTLSASISPYIFPVLYKRSKLRTNQGAGVPLC